MVRGPNEPTSTMTGQMVRPQAPTGWGPAARWSVDLIHGHHDLARWSADLAQTRWSEGLTRDIFIPPTSTPQPPLISVEWCTWEGFKLVQGRLRFPWGRVSFYFIVYFSPLNSFLVYLVFIVGINGL